jgi:hypothetical protein
MRKSPAASPRRPRARFTPRQVAHFCRLLSASGSISLAAKKSGLGRTQLYDHRKRDPAFAARWDKAMELGVARVRDEVFRRAVAGINRPVFHHGEVVGKVKHYDNRLLWSLLKAHDPDTYGDKRPRRDGAAPVDLARRLAAADERVAKYEAELLAHLRKEAK